MDKIGRALTEFREMDDLADQDSPVHSLHPLAKLIVTAAYILTVVSFGKYDLTAMSVMVLYPLALFALSGIPVKTCFYKLRVVLPLVCAVGIFNPFFDKAPMAMLGSVVISGGVLSMITLMLKGVLCLMASFALIATTSIDSVCHALRHIGLPSVIVTLVLLTYRYVGLMIEEVSVMSDAYHLRAPGQKGIHYKAWGSFLGQLLLRSRDRAEELYGSMQLRGFQGEFHYAGDKKARTADVLFTAGCTALFVLFRLTDMTRLLGGLLVHGGVR